jgi:hypothetical protein
MKRIIQGADKPDPEKLPQSTQSTQRKSITFGVFARLNECQNPNVN